MTWKFQPPSAKDSWKRSATRYKIRKVELRSRAGHRPAMAARTRPARIAQISTRDSQDLGRRKRVSKTGSTSIKLVKLENKLVKS
jgi:hypothetical protein